LRPCCAFTAAGEDERRSLAPLVEEDLAHDVHPHGIEAAHRLVQDQHVRLVEHGGDELRLLLHALRELVCPPPAPLPEAQPLQPRPETARRLPPRRALDLGEEEELLAKHHARVESPLLGHVPDAVAGGDVGGAAPDLDAALVGSEDVHHHAERRRLAGSVRPQEPEDASPRDLEREVADGDVPGEALAHSRDPDCDVGHVTSQETRL
jgi:hypothetical protein